jgi:bacteriorhodopsin
MNPQQLHDAWLVVTAVTTLTICGVAIFLLATFRHSQRRWFFWVLAIMFISVSIEQICAEVKNYYQTEPPAVDMQLLKLWLAGRVQEAVVCGLGLGYLVFGRNGKHKSS